MAKAESKPKAKAKVEKAVDPQPKHWARHRPLAAKKAAEQA
jgi:hypothetical protein